MCYGSVNKTVYSAKYHLIWCPKDRRQLVGAVEQLLKEVLAQVAGEVGAARLRRLPCLWSPSWFVSTVDGGRLEVCAATSRTRNGWPS